jgi:hypothetical protein
VNIGAFEFTPVSPKINRPNTADIVDGTALIGRGNAMGLVRAGTRSLYRGPAVLWMAGSVGPDRTRLPQSECCHARGHRLGSFWVIGVESGQVVALHRIDEGIQEFFAVLAILGRRYPDRIQAHTELICNSLVLRDEALREGLGLLRAPEPARVIPSTTGRRTAFCFTGNAFLSEG